MRGAVGVRCSPSSTLCGRGEGGVLGEDDTIHAHPTPPITPYNTAPNHPPRTIGMKTHHSPYTTYTAPTPPYICPLYTVQVSQQPMPHYSSHTHPPTHPPLPPPLGYTSLLPHCPPSRPPHSHPLPSLPPAAPHPQTIRAQRVVGGFRGPGLVG